MDLLREPGVLEHAGNPRCETWVHVLKGCPGNLSGYCVGITMRLIGILIREHAAIALKTSHTSTPGTLSGMWSGQAAIHITTHFTGL